MQGKLRPEHLTVTIQTECGHCAQSLQIVVDSELNYSVENDGAEPLVFEPEVDWEKMTAANIIDDY